MFRKLKTTPYTSFASSSKASLPLPFSAPATTAPLTPFACASGTSYGGRSSDGSSEPFAAVLG